MRSKAGVALASAVLCLACSRTGLWELVEVNSAGAGTGANDSRETGGAGGRLGSAAGAAGSGGGTAGAPPATAGTGAEAGAENAYPVTVAAGSLFSCGRGTNGGVKCWGTNRYGSLGLEDTKSRGNQPGELGATFPDIAVEPGARVRELAAGGDHVCVILESGRVQCWGRNFTGELGLGDTDNRGDSPASMGANLPLLELGTSRAAPLGATAIRVGDRHSCALLENSTLKCWGENYSGQLGSGNGDFLGDEPGEMQDALPSVDLGSGQNARSFDTGSAHTCAILGNGRVKCWGNNDYGQLGIGDTRRRGDDPNELGDHLPFVELGEGRLAVAIALGGSHSCAVLDDRTLRCWGANTFGQLGLGDTQHRGDRGGELGSALPPVDLAGAVVEVVCGDFHTCALLEDGNVKCWGYGLYGQLGLGEPRSLGDEPGEMGDALPRIDVGAGRMVVSLTSGGYHVCAVLDDATVKCWGWNNFGQLGVGDIESRGDDLSEMGDALSPVDLRFW